MRIAIVLLCLLMGCSPSSLEDFRCEGETRCRALVDALRHIDNREQLLRTEPVLKKSFESLVDLMIQAREYQERHPDENVEESAAADNSPSRLLEEELRRIYSIEGGREVIERIQQEGLVRLDAYERACSRKKQTIR